MLTQLEKLKKAQNISIFEKKGKTGKFRENLTVFRKFFVKSQRKKLLCIKEPVSNRTFAIETVHEH